MHRVVELAGTITFGAVAFVKETDVTHVAVFATTTSSAAAWIAMDPMLENKFDVL
jgi:hypothetical protein